MDEFGIGNSIKGAINILFMSARQSGRTTRMIERYQPGDRIITTSHNQSRWIIDKAKTMGKEVDCMTVDPRDPRNLFMRKSSTGRTIFDHDWLEKFWTIRTEQTFQEIKHLQDQASGEGEHHRITREAALQTQRFETPNWPDKL